MDKHTEQRIGFFSGLSAFLLWGVIPVYFKLVETISPVEIIANRVVWTLLLVFGFKLLTGRLGAFAAMLRQPRTLGLMVFTAFLLASNWLCFVYAATHDQILATSLGYFINPLVNVLFGTVLLGEQLRRVQWAAVAIAATGVLVLILRYGEVPGISLYLAFSFGLYGLARKKIQVDVFSGLALEMSVLAPLALAYLGYLTANGGNALVEQGWTMRLLLFCSGPATMIPLTLFATAARRIDLTLIGFLQYIAPSMTFLMAVFVFNEPFGTPQLITFGFIWTALAVFSTDSVLHRRRTRRRRRADAEAAALVGEFPPEAAPCAQTQPAENA